MTEDTGSVPTGEQTLESESVSTTAETTEKGEAQTQVALTAEQVQQMIAEAVTKATEEAKEAGRRELQRQQDRNRAALEREGRKARSTENLFKSVRERLQEVDPDVAKEMELEELRARDKERMTFEQEESMRRQQEQFAQAMQESLVNYLKSLDIDPNDERVDWAKEEADPIKGWDRFHSSTVKIVKENQRTMSEGFEQRLKDLEDKIAKANIEVNSVETTTPSGAVEGPDAEFLKNFGSGKLPMSKANIERYQKITEQYS